MADELFVKSLQLNVAFNKWMGATSDPKVSFNDRLALFYQYQMVQEDFNEAAVRLKGVDILKAGKFRDMEGDSFPTRQALGGHIRATGHHPISEHKDSKEKKPKVQQEKRTGASDKQGRYLERLAKVHAKLSPGESMRLHQILGTKSPKAGKGNKYKLAAYGEFAVMQQFGDHLIPINTMFRNPPVDFIDYDSGIAYEVKTFSANSKDMKVKNEIYKSGQYKGKSSTEVKQEFCRNNDLHLVTVVVVVGDEGTEMYHRDGYGNFRISGMDRIF